jgi:hypothetical protein
VNFAASFKIGAIRDAVIENAMAFSAIFLRRFKCRLNCVLLDPNLIDLVLVEQRMVSRCTGCSTGRNSAPA